MISKTIGFRGLANIFSNKPICPNQSLGITGEAHGDIIRPALSRCGFGSEALSPQPSAVTLPELA